jgi:hypothetical protein
MGFENLWLAPRARPALSVRLTGPSGAFTIRQDRVRRLGRKQGHDGRAGTYYREYVCYGAYVLAGTTQMPKVTMWAPSQRRPRDLTVQLWWDSHEMPSAEAREAEVEAVHLAIANLHVLGPEAGSSPLNKALRPSHG